MKRTKAPSLRARIEAEMLENLARRAREDDRLKASQHHDRGSLADTAELLLCAMHPEKAGHAILGRVARIYAAGEWPVWRRGRED